MTVTPGAVLSLLATATPSPAEAGIEAVEPLTAAFEVLGEWPGSGAVLSPRITQAQTG